MGTAVHLMIAAIAVIALFEFAPAVVHAKSDVERWRLLAGALLFGVVAAGLTAHRDDPLNWRVWGCFVADIAWLVSAYLSRRGRWRAEGGRARGDGPGA